ncbi:MAG: hypothetical protein Ct9H300mP1_29640 [Planctomycetaceae bacterium]|nr:MAG: hypothetical protein Ct9H300mP1_29640 [Planctomycetaceae bacterium]
MIGHDLRLPIGRTGGDQQFLRERLENRGSKTVASLMVKIALGEKNESWAEFPSPVGPTSADGYNQDSQKTIGQLPMLKILGPASSSDAFCDGLSRRNFLQVGGLGTG